MPAPRALTPDRPADAPSRHPLIASVAPALDTAFGLEGAALFPDEIAALVDALAAAMQGEPRVGEDAGALLLAAA